MRGLLSEVSYGGSPGSLNATGGRQYATRWRLTRCYRPTASALPKQSSDNGVCCNCAPGLIPGETQAETINASPEPSPQTMTEAEEGQKPRQILRQIARQILRQISRQKPRQILRQGTQANLATDSTADFATDRIRETVVPKISRRNLSRESAVRIREYKIRRPWVGVCV